MFRYTRSWYTLWLVDFDSFCQQWSVFDHREKCNMAQQKVERLRSQREIRYGGDDRLYIPSRRIRTRNKHNAEWLSKREAKREEQRNCLKHIVGRIDVFATTGFGKSLIFQLFPRIKPALEWMQDRMPFTIVVVTPLIATMKDQVELLNKIGVAAAMVGEDVDKAVKSGLDKRTSRRKAWKASCSYRYWRGPLNHRIVNFPFYCCAFSLLELTICIETAFYRNERYLFVTWFIIFFVTYTLKSCFKAVNKFIVHEYFSRSLLSESLTLGF